MGWQGWGASEPAANDCVFGRKAYILADSMPRPAPTSTDELPEELPPLDGGEDAEQEGLGDDAAIELDPLPEDDANGLDDATGENDPVGSEWLDPVAVDAGTDDAEPVDSLDVGEEATVFGNEGWLEAGAADAQEAPDEDPDMVEVDPMGADAGEEGPLDADEAIREEDLPALDADDGGEGDDAHFFDSLSADEPPLPWSSERWQPTPVVSHTDIGRIVAVAPAPLGAICLGDRLLRAEVDGAVVPLPAVGLPPFAGRALATGPGKGKSSALFVLTDEGIYRSDDGGESFAVTDEAPGDDAARSLAAAAGALTLPRGFELAAASHDGPEILAIVRAIAVGRLYVVRIARPRPGASPTAPAVAEVVAELAEPDSEGDSDRLTASWDAEHGLLWLGGSFGLLALQPGSKPVA